jgi:hypothetical protein
MIKSSKRDFNNKGNARTVKVTIPNQSIQLYLSGNGIKFQIIMTFTSTIEGERVLATVPAVYNRTCSAETEAGAYSQAVTMINAFQSHPLRPQSRWKELAELMIKHFPDFSHDNAITEAGTVDDIVCSYMERLAVPKVRKIRGEIHFMSVVYNKKPSTVGSLKRLKKAILDRNEYAWYRAHKELSENAKTQMREPFFNDEGNINCPSQIFIKSFTVFHMDIFLDTGMCSDYISHIDKAISRASKMRRPKAELIDDVALRFVDVWRYRTQLPATEPQYNAGGSERKSKMVQFVCEAMRLYGLPVSANSGAAWSRILSK